MGKPEINKLNYETRKRSYKGDKAKDSTLIDILVMFDWGMRYWALSGLNQPLYGFVNHRIWRHMQPLFLLSLIINVIGIARVVTYNGRAFHDWVCGTEVGE